MKTYTEKQVKGVELMKRLVEKAWENAAFKDQLINNPEGAIQEITNNSFTMPENKKIVVEDQTSDSIIYLNIPAEPNLDELELSDEQLEVVAGGLTPLTLVIVVGTVAGGFGSAALWDYLH